MWHLLLSRRSEAVAFLPLVDVGHGIWCSGVRMRPCVLLGDERPVERVGVVLAWERDASPRIRKVDILVLGWRLRLGDVVLKRRRLRNGECQFQQRWLHEILMLGRHKRTILLQGALDTWRQLGGIAV
jgi:hypothetical protein